VALLVAAGMLRAADSDCALISVSRCTVYRMGGATVVISVDVIGSAVVVSTPGNISIFKYKIQILIKLNNSIQTEIADA